MKTIGSFFFKQEKVSFYGSCDVMQFPEFYFGIGDNTNKDSAEYYKLNRLTQNLLLLKKINGFYFAGLNFDTQYLYGYDPSLAIKRVCLESMILTELPLKKHKLTPYD